MAKVRRFKKAFAFRGKPVRISYRVPHEVPGRKGMRTVEKVVHKTVGDDEILEGEQFARWVKAGVLREVAPLGDDEPVVEPEPEPEPEPEDEPSEEEDIAVEKAMAALSDLGGDTEDDEDDEEEVELPPKPEQWWPDSDKGLRGDYWSAQRWIDEAAENGINVTDDEAGQKKKDLCVMIRARAQEKYQLEMEAYLQAGGEE